LVVSQDEQPVPRALLAVIGCLQPFQHEATKTGSSQCTDLSRKVLAASIIRIAYETDCFRQFGYLYRIVAMSLMPRGKEADDALTLWIARLDFADPVNRITAA
jgi:hypothetical protein